MVVADTHMMVADIHRNALAGQDGGSRQKPLVGVTCSFIDKKILTIA